MYWIKRKGLVFGAAFLVMVAPLQLGAHDISSKVPKEARERKNPLPHEETVIKKGKELYTDRCLTCHGSSGKGDGPAAASLGHRLPDLTRVLAGQTDGALLWKISIGGGAMPSYEKTLTEKERWQMIHYLRTLEGKEKGRGR
jgi:mono/diheme cytochrome c family protein